MASNSPYVIDVTEANFNEEVAHRSADTPVLLDMWASWCGPCKTLGPVLEALAEEYKGAFILAKVDVDANPRLAQMVAVQSIPTVVAIFDGARVDQFVGALPRQELKRFIDGVLEKCGVSGPATDEGPPTDPAEAEAYWQARLDEDMEDGAALLGLGRLYLLQKKKAEALALLEAVKATMPEFSAAQAALALGGLSAELDEAGGEQAARERLQASPEDAEARYLVSLAEALSGRFAAGLEGLVALVGSAGPELKDKAKAAAATVFEAAGRDDEAVENLRRKLARLLY